MYLYIYHKGNDSKSVECFPEELLAHPQAQASNNDYNRNRKSQDHDDEGNIYPAVL
jgi:hypothetical protein